MHLRASEIEKYQNYIQSQRSTSSHEQQQSMQNFTFDTKKFNEFLDSSPELYKTFYNRTIYVHLHTDGIVGHVSADLPLRLEDGTIIMTKCIGLDPAANENYLNILLLGAKGEIYEQQRATGPNKILTVAIQVTQETYEKSANELARYKSNSPAYRVDGTLDKTSNNNCIKFMHFFLNKCGIVGGLYEKFPRDQYNNLDFRLIKIQAEQFVSDAADKKIESHSKALIKRLAESTKNPGALDSMPSPALKTAFDQKIKDEKLSLEKYRSEVKAQQRSQDIEKLTLQRKYNTLEAKTELSNSGKITPEIATMATPPINRSDLGSNEITTLIAEEEKSSPISAKLLEEQDVKLENDLLAKEKEVETELKQNTQQKEQLLQFKKERTLPATVLSFTKVASEAVYRLQKAKFDADRFAEAKEEVKKQLDAMHRKYGIHLDLEKYNSSNSSLPDLRTEFIQLFQSHEQNKLEESEKLFKKILSNIQDAKDKIARRKSNKEEYTKNITLIHREQKDLAKQIKSIKYNNMFSYLSGGFQAAASADFEPCTKAKLAIASFVFGTIGDAYNRSAEKRLQKKKGLIDGYNAVEHTYAAMYQQISSEILADQMFIASQQSLIDQNSLLINPEDYRKNLIDRLESHQNDLATAQSDKSKLEKEKSKLDEALKPSLSNAQKLLSDKGKLERAQTASEQAANKQNLENVNDAIKKHEKAIMDLEEKIMEEESLKDIKEWAYKTLRTLENEKSLSKDATVRVRAYEEGCAMYQAEIAAISGAVNGLKSILDPLRPYIGSRPEQLLFAGALIHQAHVTFEIMDKFSMEGFIKILSSTDMASLSKNFEDFGGWTRLLTELLNPSLLLLGKATSLLMSIWLPNQDPLQVTLRALEAVSKKLSAQIQSGFERMGVELSEIKETVKNIEILHIETRNILTSMIEKSQSLSRLYTNNILAAAKDINRKVDNHFVYQLERDISSFIFEMEKSIKPNIAATGNFIGNDKSKLVKYLSHLDLQLNSSLQTKFQDSSQAMSPDSLSRMKHYSHQINYLGQLFPNYKTSNYCTLPNINVYLSVGQMLNLLLTKAKSSSLVNLKSHMESHPDIMSTYLPNIRKHGENLLTFMQQMQSKEDWIGKLECEIKYYYQSLQKIVKKELDTILASTHQIDTNKILSESATIIDEMKGNKFIGSHKFYWQEFFFGENKLKDNVPTTLYWKDCQISVVTNAINVPFYTGLSIGLGILFPPSLIVTIPLTAANAITIPTYVKAGKKLSNIKSYNSLISLIKNNASIFPEEADLIIYFCPITKVLKIEAYERLPNGNKSMFEKIISPFKLILSHHLISDKNSISFKLKNLFTPSKFGIHKYNKDADITLVIGEKEIFISQNELPNFLQNITTLSSAITSEYKKTYDTALNNSIDSYQRALNTKLSQTEQKEESKIALTDISDGVLIQHQSSQKGKTKLLPIFLPKNYLSSIQKHPLIADVFAEKEHSAGLISHTYRLQPGINKKGEICLQFILTYQFTNIHKAKYDLLDVVVGSVDFKTFQTYKKMIFSDTHCSHDINPNELLLEFMFGTVAGTGLTAQGSLDLNDDGEICPKVLPFPGLYQILKQSKRFFHYDSTKYSEEASAKLMEYAKTGGNIPDQLKSFFADELTVIPQEGYFRFQQNMSDDKKEIYHRLLANNDYKILRDKIFTLYETLATALKINFNLDYQTIVDLLGQANIPHPDLLDIMAKDNFGSFLTTLSQLTINKSELLKVLKPFLAKSSLFCNLEATVKNIEAWCNAMQDIISGKDSIVCPINLHLWEIPVDTFDRPSELILRSEITSNPQNDTVPTYKPSGISMFNPARKPPTDVWSDPKASASSACGI